MNRDLENTDRKSTAAIGLGLLALLSERNNQAALQGQNIPSFYGPPNQFVATPTGGGAGLAALRAMVAADVPNLPAAIITSGLLDRAVGGLGVSAASVAANQHYSGPVSGGPAAAAFRALVAADIPSLDASVIGSGILGGARGGLGVNASSVGQALFFGGPAASAGAPTFRALLKSDVPGLQNSLATGTLPFINLTGADQTNARNFQTWDAPNSTHWRVYLNQIFWLLTRNCTTADGVTFTKEVSTEMAVIYYYDWNGMYKHIVDNNSATTSFTLSTAQTYVRYDPLYTPIPFVKGASVLNLSIVVGGFCKAAAAGNVIKFPVNYGVWFETAPATLTLTPISSVNVSGTPSFTNNGNYGAVLNVTALAGGDVTYTASLLVTQ